MKLYSRSQKVTVKSALKTDSGAFDQVLQSNEMKMRKDLMKNCKSKGANKISPKLRRDNGSGENHIQSYGSYFMGIVFFS